MGISIVVNGYGEIRKVYSHFANITVMDSGA